MAWQRCGVPHLDVLFDDASQLVYLHRRIVKHGRALRQLRQLLQLHGRFVDGEPDLRRLFGKL